MSRYLNLYLHHIYYNLVIVLHDRMMMGLLPLLHGLQFTVYLFALKGYIYIFSFLVILFCLAWKFTKLFSVSKLMLILFSM